KYPAVEISAKSGDGVDELLETILIQAEVLELKANPHRRAKGVVIEARKEKGKGTVCTVLVQSGTLKVGNYFVCGQFYGRVRATHNERWKKIKETPPSSPAQVLGFSGMPQAGDSFIVMESDKAAKELSQKRKMYKREQDFRKTSAKSLFDISKQVKTGKIKELFLILKADSDGSVEALVDSFSKLKSEEVEVKVIHKSIGAITQADILLAAASHAIILGFHVRPNLDARNLAEKEEVEIHLYDVIYDAIADVKAALEGMLEPDISEEVVATAEVRETFKVPKTGTIAGSYVISGTIERNSKIRLIREGIVTYDGTINSLKRFKEDAKEVATGFECGISLDNFNDIKVGDILETYITIEEKRVLK
ncbi:translation initiation factor IF-2, partial [candidate division KSB1 bacterium]